MKKSLRRKNTNLYNLYLYGYNYLCYSGYISRKLLVNGEMWANLVVWETMDDALKALNAANEDAVAVEYVSLMDEKSIDLHHFTVEKSYAR